MNHRDIGTALAVVIPFIYIATMAALDIRQVKKLKNKQKIGATVTGTPVVVTLQMLRRHDACDEYTLRFRSTFGDSTPVTEEICVTNAEGFYWGWASDRLLTTSGQSEYNVAARAAEAVKLRAVRVAYQKFTDLSNDVTTTRDQRSHADTVHQALKSGLIRTELEEQARAFAYAATTHGLRR